MVDLKIWTKVISVILSCQTAEQFESAEKYLDLFEKKYGMCKAADKTLKRKKNEHCRKEYKST